MTIVKTILTKRMTAGLFKGLSVREYVSFVDWDTAIDWSEAQNKKPFKDYIVLQIEDIESDRSIHFSL